MRESKEIIEKRILEEIHPYRIYENKNVPGQWATHLPDPELNDDLTFTEKKMVTENYLKGCTSQGYRMEYLTDDAIDILRQAKAINPDGEFVFMPFGKPILTTTFNKRLRKYCEAAGIPYRSSHKIRFYAASTAYDGNNLVSVSRMMGHSQTSTTLHYLRDVNQDDSCAELFKKLGKQR